MIQWLAFQFNVILKQKKNDWLLEKKSKKKSLPNRRYAIL